MSEVLRKKLGTARPPNPLGAISVEALLRKTMPRDADATLSLDMSVTGFQSGALDKAALLDALAPTDLVYLLQTDDGARGIVRLDRGLVAALIEVQVSGRVTAGDPGDRRPTRTDGIVASEIVDRWLASAAEAVVEAGLETTWPASGFRRLDGILGRREADLALDPVEFRTVDIEMSLGAGAKAGAIRFAAPRLVPLLERQDTTMLARVRGHLPHFPVVLHAVLSRQAVDVAAVRGLQEGDVIRLPEHCLQQIRLETASGGLIRKARLGQLGGHRAVRLSEPVQTPAPGADAASLAPLAAMPLAAPVDDPLPHSPDDLPEMPDTADTAQPAAPVLPDLPPLGSAMDADGLPDLPELPELPELPDLPDLPEHP